MLTSKVQKTKPIARISKDYLGNKSIYKIFVRSPSTKEIIQTNQERIIFFLCNFKIYSITQGKVAIVDTGYKFREVKSNILAYNTVDQNNKKTNEIKYLVIAHSDYQKVKIYEEVDGKLLEYLVQDGQLLTLVKPDKGSEHIIKIFNVDDQNQIKLKCQIPTEDRELIGNLQTVNYYQNNMIPSGNDLYTIVNTGDSFRVHSFKNVIPCLPNSGHTISFYSPLMNTLYRRMIYFVTNKKFLRAKRAIVLPYITDNFVQFNKRTNITQFCTFQEHKKSYPSTKSHQNVLCYVPFTQQMLYYNLKGQLKEAKSVIEEHQRYGETTVAVSQNGMVFLQRFEEEISRANLHLIKQYISYKSVNEDPGTDRLSNQEDEQIYFKIPKTAQTQKIDEPQKKVSIKCKNQIDLLDHIKLNELMLYDNRYESIHKLFLNDILLYFAQQGCEIVYRVNDNLDVLIGLVHHSKLAPKGNKPESKILKELLLLKRNGESRVGDHTYSREVIRIRLEDNFTQTKISKPDQPRTENDQEQIKKSDTQKVRDLNQKVFKNLKELGDQKDNELQLFLGMHELMNCQDFILTNERIIVWSKTSIYFGDFHKTQEALNEDESPVFLLKKAKFEIEHSDEAQISSIYSSGQNQEDIEMKNYYVYIKVCVEGNYSFVLKYNIDKNKEFSSFDCSIDSQICFDSNHEGYVFDSEAIIDSDQGIPLYFYKDCLKNYNQSYFLLGDISKGPRFCSQKQHFMIRNKIYLPYSYFCLILFDKAAKEQGGTLISNENYDPEVFYFYGGQTVLHAFSNNFKALEFILNKYHQTKPSLLNMLLIKDSNNMNVLQRAIQNGNTRCVKLILDKLAAITMNNIHAIKWNFCDLLEYNGFEEYLRLCFFQTKQMQSKQNFQRKQKSESAQFVIGPNETSFLDKGFYKDFQDQTQPMKQVIIRALDAGWILRSEIGQQFQIALSESENMDYFAIETIQTIVNFQWNILKPKIIVWLFIPFLVNMGLYSYYSIYSYEELINSRQQQTDVDAITLTNQILILLFSIQTFYVEYKQMTFHKKEYFKSFWNILDLTTVILAPLTVIMAFTSTDEKIVRPFMAICNLIFYLRFFYFLRIFDSSSHLVRTIIEITADIKNFIFVFIMAIIGLGGSFLILANNNDKTIEESQFIQTFPQAFIYSYRLGLGDFDLDPYAVSTNTIILHLLFILSSLFSAVILLNMLVAIMGESFNRVNETAENQRVREHLQLIVENDFLINRKRVFANVKYLIEIKDDVDEDDKDLITQQICKAQTDIKQNHVETSQQMNDIKRMLQTQDRKMLQLRTQLNEISNFLNRQRVEGNDVTLRTFDTFSIAQNYSSRNSQVLVTDNTQTLSMKNEGQQ